MEKPGTLIYQCNICGKIGRTPMIALNREEQSCKYCASTVRMRAMIHTLSIALFGKCLTLPEFPERKDILGKGMSDWDGYSIPLSQKLGYMNTFYHKKPRLDITNISEDDLCSIDFLISTDVFEHVVPPVSYAFENARKMLKPGGAFVFSVPYTLDGDTIEHFPNLFDYRLTRQKGRRVLLNRTRDGIEEVFSDLVFHGGEGETLEIRIFSESGLLKELNEAGFENVMIMNDSYFPYGIYWPYPGSLPIIAREEAISIKIESWGPQYAKVGSSFNKQADGKSALWIKIKNHLPTMPLQIYIGGKQANGVVQKNDLITALIPCDLLETPGAYPVELHNTTTNNRHRTGILQVEA